MNLLMVMNDRLRQIDLLKFLGMLLVVAWHVPLIWTWAVKHPTLNWIQMVVPMYMVTTGYVLARLCGNAEIVLPWGYWQFSRLGRILLRFLLPFFIVFLAEMVYSLVSMENYGVADCVRGFLVGGAGPGGYYVPVILQITFFYPCVYLIVRRYALRGLFVIVGLNLLFEVLVWAYQLNLECYRLLSFRYLGLIGFGTWLQLAPRETVLRNLRNLALISASGFVCLCIITFTDWAPPVFGFWKYTSLPVVSVLCLPMAWALCSWHYDGLKWLMPIEIMGRYTLEMFLIQKLYFFTCGNLVGRHLHNYAGQYCVATLVMVAGCFLLNVPEKRLLRWFRSNH